MACSAGAAETVPTSFLLKVSSPPGAPVSRLPQRRDRVPVRCGLRLPTAQRVKTAQEVAGESGGALVLVLTAVLSLDSRTGGMSSLPTSTSEETTAGFARSKHVPQEVFA